MKIKKLIAYLIKSLPKENTVCNDCMFYYKEIGYHFCGFYDKIILKHQRCKECVDIFETYESNVILKTKYK